MNDWQQRFPNRADHWQLRSRSLQLGRRPLLMGVLNVTPDSFSDGGTYLNPAAALEHAVALTEAGADILDIGGESTQPFSAPVDASEEIRRVLPVIEALGPEWPIPISIDTSKAEVAWAALQMGAEIVNDVTALADPRMIGVIQETGAAVCAMHMQGTPQTMQIEPQYNDVVAEVAQSLRERRDALVAAGIPVARIALDPGIGFGKTHQHNLALVADCQRLHELGCPLVVGHSRKGFIGKVLGDKTADRTFGSIGVALALAMQGVQVLRVHDVAATREAVLLFTASGGLR